MSPQRGHLFGAFAAMLFVGVSWGANLPVTKVMLGHFDLVPMVALRTGMAALSLALLLALLEGRRSLRIDVGLPRFLMLGLLAAGFFAMYAVGIYFSNPISAAAVQAAGPLMAAIKIGRASCRERV